MPGRQARSRPTPGTKGDIGPAMTAKMLKRNGQTVHRTTLRGLSDDKVQDPAELASRNSFDKEIERRLGPSAKPGDFEDKDDAKMANPDLHEDEEEGKTFVPNRDDLRHQQS